MSEWHTYFDDRRKHIRMPYVSSVGYYFPSRPLDRNKAYTVNVSSRGVCLLVNELLPKGQYVEIESGVLSFLCSTARVCWIREFSPVSYIAGLEICLSA